MSIEVRSSDGPLSTSIGFDRRSIQYERDKDYYCLFGLVTREVGRAVPEPEKACTDGTAHQRSQVKR